MTATRATQYYSLPDRSQKELQLCVSRLISSYNHIPVNFCRHDLWLRRYNP